MLNNRFGAAIRNISPRQFAFATLVGGTIVSGCAPNPVPRDQSAPPINDPIPNVYLPSDPNNAGRYGTATGILGGSLAGRVIDEALGDGGSGYGQVIGGVYGGLAGGAVARDVAEERERARTGCRVTTIQRPGRMPQVKQLCPDGRGGYVVLPQHAPAPGS